MHSKSLHLERMQTRKLGNVQLVAELCRACQTNNKKIEKQKLFHSSFIYWSSASDRAASLTYCASNPLGAVCCVAPSEFARSSAARARAPAKVQGKEGPKRNQRETKRFRCAFTEHKGARLRSLSTAFLPSFLPVALLAKSVTIVSIIGRCSAERAYAGARNGLSSAPMLDSERFAYSLVKHYHNK